MALSLLKLRGSVLERTQTSSSARARSGLEGWALIGTEFAEEEDHR